MSQVQRRYNPESRFEKRTRPMNIEHENLRTLDEQELEQISGGISAFGYHADASIINFGQGPTLHLSWGKDNGKYNYYEINLC